ncbi:NADH-dependent flavin oxidoreductase [Bifidobacterium samirii]|uniref:NADH-dependent oxidoreductase n=1 Tax=Bifidobacterium samirii TaxID=2306974 RepID=A0A430FW04_9BIFI|nr:NADH-dependent flavin oxidoreductase [Bifidobacterium samirii]RSX58371.1 NADH-dependent oxidoreductase [Bifidobacterium samirii]
MTRTLTEPVTLRHGAVITNRIAMAPMQTSSGRRNGFVSDETIDYYAARSQAAGLLITEFHYVSENGGPCYNPGYPEQLAAYSDAHLDGLRRLAAALKKDGNKAVLQIHHGGYQAVGRALSGEDVLAVSGGDYPFLRYPVREMTEVEIEDVIADFGRATRRAIEAGFDGVEIHGANHYLLQQFFSATSNRRTDRWGGSLEARMRFPLAVVDEVMRVVDEQAPDGFIVGYRISPEELHDDQAGYTYRESMQLVAEIVRRGLDYIHLSLWHGYASGPADTDESYAALFRRVLDDETKLIVVGNVFSEEAAADAIANYGDLIAVGRGTLVDPRFAAKVMDGRGDEIRHEITPEALAETAWTSGLHEAFTRGDALGLQPLPGGESIRHLHTGRYDMKGLFRK